MTTPFTPEPKFFEHPKYSHFLASLDEPTNFTLNATPEEKQARFSAWLNKEDAADFKNLVHMRISMNTEEWNWFTTKLAEDEDSHLPNLKALADHPPKGFKDLD